MLIKNNSHSACSVWELKTCFKLRFKFILKIPGKNVSYTPVKNTPTRNRIPRPNPKIFLIIFPDPRPVSVRSGPGKLGVRVALQVFTMNWHFVQVSMKWCQIELLLPPHFQKSGYQAKHWLVYVNQPSKALAGLLVYDTPFISCYDYRPRFMIASQVNHWLIYHKPAKKIIGWFIINQPTNSWAGFW